MLWEKVTKKGVLLFLRKNERCRELRLQLTQFRKVEKTELEFSMRKQAINEDSASPLKSKRHRKSSDSEQKIDIWSYLYFCSPGSWVLESMAVKVKSFEYFKVRGCCWQAVPVNFILSTILKMPIRHSSFICSWLHKKIFLQKPTKTRIFTQGFLKILYEKKQVKCLFKSGFRSLILLSPMQRRNQLGKCCVDKKGSEETTNFKGLWRANPVK